jgi:ParB family transcriptional regulator, chromosome partitioning protein
MPPKHGLGRGLEALIKDASPAAKAPQPDAGPKRVPIQQIRKNTWQPRHEFEPEGMAELVESVRQHGILQPLLVRPAATGYELIAGERRLRAATEAGLQDVPVVVMPAEDALALELALVENLQRRDLNVIEEAEGYQVLSERFGMTQEQIATRVGKARASVANSMRLLALPAEVRALIVSGQLSSGHAKVLLGVEIDEERVLLARRAVDEGVTVRQLERLFERAKHAPRRARVSRSDIPQDHVKYLADRLHAYFGTAVRISPCRTYANGKKGKGLIEVEYYSNDDLDRILNVLGIAGE